MIGSICIGSIICIVAAIAGDTSQDLKTGFIVGATPKLQQIGEMVGVIASSAAIGYVLYLLNAAWGFGSNEIPAPQATMMKMLVEGIMNAELPWALILVGVFIAIVVEILGIPVLPFAVGMYLPFSLSAGIMAGGVVRWILERRKAANENEEKEKKAQRFPAKIRVRKTNEKRDFTMKFVTFNIRCDFGQDGANNFIYRRPLIVEKIRQEKPDIIGFQEVLPHVAAWLKENLTEYYIAGCGREKDLTGEAMIIAYRKERFQSVSLETFWLSPTPYVPGSRYPVQSMCPRTATDVVFEDMETGKVFRVSNTQLDHECAGARKLGLEQILAHLRAEKAFADVPVILSGDFNAEPDSEEMKPLRETAGLVNATEGIGITFHNYHRDDPNDPQCSIDYIILKGDWELKKVEKWTEQKDGVCLSDHDPICAELI